MKGIVLSEVRLYSVDSRVSLVVFSVEVPTLTIRCNLFKNIPNVKRRERKTAPNNILRPLFYIFVCVFHFRGYLGAGGIQSNSLYSNCTGGATGYLDRMLLGENHMYRHAAVCRVYQTPVPFDPENILGTYIIVKLINETQELLLDTSNVSVIISGEGTLGERRY